MRTVKVFEEAWPLHTPFVIARNLAVTRVVVVELEESVKAPAKPHPRYGESDALGNGAIMSIVPQRKG